MKLQINLALYKTIANQTMRTYWNTSTTILPTNNSDNDNTRKKNCTESIYKWNVAKKKWQNYSSTKLYLNVELV